MKSRSKSRTNRSSVVTHEARLARLECQMAKLEKEVWGLDKALEQTFIMAASKPSEKWLVEFLQALDIRYQRRE